MVEAVAVAAEMTLEVQVVLVGVALDKKKILVEDQELLILVVEEEVLETLAKDQAQLVALVDLAS